jgi:hypothetical protein
MSLCDTCESIDLLNIPKLPATCNGYPAKNKSSAQVLVYRRRTKQADAEQSNRELLGLPFHQSLNVLDEAAGSCSICKVVRQDVTRLQKELAELEPDEQKNGKSPDWKMYLAKGANEISGFMVVSMDSGNSAVVWVLSAVGLCVHGWYSS